ncbi:hypothetical protein CkaCkLH20_08708 [Colletotrichum karsti]|uniref:Uncharacterized protein n=1 Tax=Colletotrichum karsti TaxID=1095194 RepID=A0A9P6LFB5_9PEZI|nr:uncharacterized protein CkaCkLH20_08708 [Colletotrichum karsti]KAF9873974.1 hypothetical protein CkaCkLH20_08708 [Colletotrichum karsti]
MQFSTVSNIILASLIGQVLAGPVSRASKAGKACTAQIDGFDSKGTCNNLGECSIDIPPNITSNVPSDDCK